MTNERQWPAVPTAKRPATSDASQPPGLPFLASFFFVRPGCLSNPLIIIRKRKAKLKNVAYPAFELGW